MTDDHLREAGLRLIDFLIKQKFKDVQEVFGYALSYGRPCEQALKDDWESALDKCTSSNRLRDAPVNVEVSHLSLMPQN